MLSLLFDPDALSRRTKLTRYNSVETRATFDAANHLLELTHLLLPLKFVWASPSTWLSTLASFFQSFHSSLVTPHSSLAEAAPPTVSAVRPIQLPPDVLATVAYTYDAVGNRLSAVGSTQGAGGSNFTYQYDPLSQLDTATEAALGLTNYEYDAVGNRTQVVDPVGTTPYTPNNLNQYATVGSTTYQYDPNGNLTFDGTTTYTYDAENRLITATVSGLPTSVYAYDAFGRRISKTVNGTTTKFTYDGDQILEELNASDQQLAEYINGSGIDEPLRMQRGTTKSYYLVDGLGSIIGLTNPQGKIVEQYTYDPYGKPSIFDGAGNPLTASAFGNHYLFTGREYDQETGLQFNRARYYNPSIGRFLSRDPLTWGPNDPRLFELRTRYNQQMWLVVFGLARSPHRIVSGITRSLMANGSRFGLYAYVFNNPLRWLDPYGLDKQSISLEDALDFLFGIENAFADDFEKWDNLSNQNKQQTTNLLFMVGASYVAIGMAAITIGIITYPYFPWWGAGLIGGGFYLEAKGIIDFAQWAKNYGELQNAIKNFEEEY